MKVDIVKRFIKERDEALLSLDRDKIEAYLRKYQVPVPQDDEVFWRGVHKAICEIESAPEYPQKGQARNGCASMGAALC